MTAGFHRRNVLRGLSASVALPWLESLPAEQDQVSENEPPRRFAFLFFGDGIHPPEWWSKGSGADLELGPAFGSLEGMKQKVNFIHGLHHPDDVVGGHAKGAAGILTGVRPQGGREIKASTSMDQLLVRHFGDQTPVPGLALACERPVSGFHESGFSMMYSSHVSWSSPVAPVPTELHPGLAFDSLFESGGSQVHLSVLDHVSEQLRGVVRRVSVSDRGRIDEYATSVRELELRIRRLRKSDSETTAESEVPAAERPAGGIPGQLDEHSRLMCDIIALAFQTDRTRVATLMLTNNLSGQVYPFLGLKVDHHNYSHNWQNSEFASIARFWVQQYAYLLGRLDAMPEGDGTVLDHSCIMLANEQWTAHSAPRIPLLMAGGLNGRIRTGQTVDYESAKERKLSSLLLNVMDHMGLHLTEFGNADQYLPGI